jgi:hypothetical protein
MIVVSRVILLGLAALFSAYHVFLGIYSLGVPEQPGPTIAAMVLFVAATTMSLLDRGRGRLPIWLAAFDLAVAIAMVLLVTSQLEGGAQNGHATWYVAAVGTLMTIVAVRRRWIFAVFGVGFLAISSVVWAGPLSLVSLGVIGSIVWVAAAVVVTHALAVAAKGTQQFVRVERKAAEWQATQEAHVSERQYRLEQTYRLAEPMLTEIVRRGGRLTDDQRRECRLLESSMRDEIRGRRLLDDDVRAAVIAARRGGTVVMLLDEGGIDDLEGDALAAVQARIAEALRTSTADKLIVRTVPLPSDTAVTVVGLSASAGDPADEDVDLWLEIPRESTDAGIEAAAPAGS